MNMQEAADHADGILDATLKAIKPPVKWGRSASRSAGCTDFKNDGTGKGDVKQSRYVLTKISAERRGSFMGVVERHWKRSGYKITSVRDSKDMPAIFASTPDGYALALKIGYKGQAFLDVTSPCVNEAKVSDPPMDTLDPDDPASKGLPYLHSDFWSATTPAPRKGSD
ncbi:hypothetical protein CP975_26365 [Streptomyces alboniger]|uniref:Uncharacterized protein n=2 Tax=Streptomyces alboniger TaxID=132473 RepID=A0A5J6HZY2_STRAD|nr:hypothetical protein CP975_26365 [Streptomyces alboniger]